MTQQNPLVDEVTTLYAQIYQQLNHRAIPQWLELDLTFQQMRVLYLLKEKGPQKMSELSTALKVSMPTITGIISRLIERKNSQPLVERVTSPEDRRQVWAHLTPAGQKVTEMMDELNRFMLTEALSALDQSSIEQARAGLNFIINALGNKVPAATKVEAEPVLVTK